MSARPMIDGQRRQRDPELSVGICDGDLIDLQLTPQPLVFEHSTHEPYYMAGGDWIDTTPDLGSGVLRGRP